MGLRAASLAEIDSIVAVSPWAMWSIRRFRLASCGKPVVRMSGVVAGYRGAPAVLNGLDFCLLPGSVVGIVGHNGLGKRRLPGAWPASQGKRRG